MDPGRWDDPITYETMTLGQFRTIGSALEAAHALTGQWPVYDGHRLHQAQQTCLDVLEGRLPAAAAREAFLLAAEEADIFIRP